MKVLFGYLTQQFRGGTKFQLDFASNFADTEVGFVTSNKRVDYYEKAQAIGTVHIIPPTKQIRARIKALKEFAKIYDVIYLNKATLTFIELYVIKKAGFKKIVFHSHSTSKDCKNPVIKAGYILLHYISRSAVCSAADRLYACSVPAGEWLFGKNKPFKVINNGIDVEAYRFNPGIRETERVRLGVSGDVIFHVGSFSAVKNQNYLIDAFAEYRKDHGNSVLMFAGDGELIDDCRHHAKELGLGDSVKFLGQRSDIPALMQAADIFVLPSKVEGLPFVAIEAQSAGLPCLLTDVASDRAKITDVCEFFSIDDPTADLARRIEKMLEISRHDTANSVINAGFDIGTCAENLEKDLISLLNS